MLVQYDPALVALSVVIAIQGGYVSLALAHRLAHSGGARRKAFLAASALSLGVGIWAMHFIGMLAVKLPVAINYDVLLTLLSALLCVLVVGLGVFLASFGPLTPLRLATAGLLMGCGTSTMHYVGMAAIRANCIVTYSPAMVAASVVVGVAAATIALRLAFSSARKPHLMAGAATMGLAISGMHYTAMMAATFLPAEVLAAYSSPALSLDLLAIIVAVTAFLITGFFLLVLLPERLAPATRSKPLTTPSEQREADFVGGMRIPVTQNGTTRLLSHDQVYAVHADAHYTHVFDGTETHFCNLSISELETRLDPERFLRVHRSHIVNVAHAAALRRVRDQGEIELDSEARHTVPVSRSRMSKLRAALGL